MTSELIVDGEVVYLPSCINNEPSLLKEILTLSAWNELSVDEQTRLQEMLPQSLSQEDKDVTIRKLFSGDDLAPFSGEIHENSSENPINDLVQKLGSGYFSTEAYQIRRSRQRAMKAKEKYESARYYHNILKEVIVSRQCHLAVASYPQLLRLSRQNIQTDEPPDAEAEIKIHESAEKMYSSVLYGVKREIVSSTSCIEEDLISSDSDSELRTSQANQRQLPSNMYSVTPKRFREMLVQHKRRREAKINTPDLNINGIKLADVVSRTFGGSKKSSGIIKRRKREESLKSTKVKKLKTKVEQPSVESKDKVKTEQEKKILVSSPSCFFILIRDALLLLSNATIAQISLLVSDWLLSAASSHHGWTTTRSNWIKLAESALIFMSTSHKVSEERSVEPFTKVSDSSWTWVGLADRKDEESLLESLCEMWLNEVVGKHDLSNSDSTDDSLSFRSQERRRFLNPHHAFVYHIDRKRYTVPPVKGSTGPAKEGKVAREHILLKSERPPQVTILALTRDAVARLPEGKGTRTVVCKLLRDSQYLVQEISDAQINAAVSGALDRLHYEADPCVKFDVSVRLWFYLHGDRTAEELERMHAEQLGAPKKKKERGSKRPKSKAFQARKKMVLAKYEIGTESNQASAEPENAESGDTPIIDVTKVDVTSPLVINEKPESSKAKAATPKKRAKKAKETLNANGAKKAPNQPNHPSPSLHGARTIQLTQKQLLEMTKNLPGSKPPRPAREAREVPIPGEQSPARHFKPKPASVQPQQLVAGQPGLKLILKPAGGDQQRPVAELVRVVEPSPNSQPRVSNTKQQVLTVEALRRLSEQLSAVSSRPIKIVQQATPTNVKSPSLTPGPRLINITSPGEAKLIPGTKTVRAIPVSNQTLPMASIAPSSGVFPTLALPQGGANSPAMYISAGNQREIVFGKQQNRETSYSPSRVVHLIHKPAESSPLSKAKQQNVQVIHGKPQSVQIMQSGKLQSIQVLRDSDGLAKTVAINKAQLPAELSTAPGVSAAASVTSHAS